MKQMLINSMVSFTLGTGASLIGIMAWTGSTDLQEIKSLVENHMTETEQQVSLFMQEDYKVQVDNANAEIGEYQVALAEANGNINKLISAYQQAEQEHQAELKQAEQDLSDLQVELGKMQTRLDSQYEQDMNAIIEQANGEIQKANEQVAETKQYIEEDLLPTSQIDEYIQRAKEYDKVNTGGDKSVVEITDIVGE